MNNRRTGSEKERFAAEYLSGQGMRILEMNFRNRQGEIDIVGSHEGFLVFVEVKYRSSRSCGTPLEAVGPGKQRQICKVAEYYLYSRHIPADRSVRYDVVSLEPDEVLWIKNAFYHVGWRQ